MNDPYGRAMPTTSPHWLMPVPRLRWPVPPRTFHPLPSVKRVTTSALPDAVPADPATWPLALIAKPNESAHPAGVPSRWSPPADDQRKASRPR
jgi:hypothetical protein